MTRIETNAFIDELRSRYDRLQVFLSSQGVSDIILVTEYFLDKCISGSKEELVYNLFGFVIALRSIPDHLLHDYYVKYFGRVIKDHIELMKVEPDKLYHHIFRDKANETGHQIAIAFYERWKSQMDKFWEDKDIGFLFNMRDITIHRKVVSRPHFIVVSEGKEGFGFEKRDEEDRIYYDNPIALCKSCLEHMKQFVNDIKSEF